MKMRFENDTIGRVESNDGSCTKCCFVSDTPCCNPILIDLCVTDNIGYTFRPYASDDSIFLI